MKMEEFKTNLNLKLKGVYPDKVERLVVIDKISCQRNEFRSILKSTGRDGIDQLLDYLDECGFYYRPSSDVRHHNYPGGLLEHSLGVYKNMLKSSLPESYNDSVKIVGLLHDVCKCDKFYFVGRSIMSHSRDGHGSRSIRILTKFSIKLTTDEYHAIRYHMRELHRNSHPLRIAVVKADKKDAAESRSKV